MIDFIVYDMTHLRYFVPFTESLVRLGFKVRWLIVMPSIKYNSISGDRLQRVLDIGRAAGCTLFDNFDQNSAGDCAVTIETGAPSDRIPSRYDTVISMQHGFDYTTPARASGTNVLNIMWDQIYADQHATIKQGCKYLIPSVPIPFWIDRSAAEKVAGSGRIATVFYPEVGYHTEAANACSELILHGITPVVKQRRKNQEVPSISGCRVAYDDIWHPSESIVYPVCSEFCVGFGTGAYADAVPAGISFVDCTGPKYSREYLKPKSERYIQCSPGGEVDAIRSALQVGSSFLETTHNARDEFTDLAMESLNVQRS